MADYVKEPQNPLHTSDSELNLENISTTVPIDISVKPGIIENIHMITSSTISFDDPWILPSDSELDYFNGVMPLSHFEVSYQEV